MKTSFGFAAWLSALAAVGWLGCAPVPHAAPKPLVSPLRSLFVQVLEGPGGAAVTAEFVHDLSGSGLKLVGRRQDADAVLTGAVEDYTPAKKLMVILGTASTILANGETAVVSNAVVSLNSSQASAQNAAMALNNPQIMAVTASVGVTARLVDASTGALLWTNDFSYESLSLPDALHTAAGVLAKSLVTTAPRIELQRPAGKKG